MKAAELNFFPSSTPASRRGSSRLVWGLSCATILLALFFGGGTTAGLGSDALVQVFSLGLLGAVLWSGDRAAAERLRGPLVLVALIFLLPLLQLVPLPASIWTSLPGRELFADGFRAAGMRLPWEPISLDPAATSLSLFSMIPAIATFIAALFLDLRQRRFLSLLILAFTGLSVLLGLAQLAGGPESPLRFYDPTNSTQAVGFFANRNHYAALLSCSIPLVSAWIVGHLATQGPRFRLSLMLLLVAYPGIMLGLGTAYSRAGLILGLVGGLGSIPLMRDKGASGRRSGALLLLFCAAVLLGLGLAFQFGFVGISERLQAGVLTDLRWPAASIVAGAIKRFFPVGTGFGTFVPVYQLFEGPDMLWDAFLNHADNDWLELALTGGLPALAVLLAFLLWFVRQSVRVWWQPPPHVGALDRALPRAASIIVVLLLLHSTVDYPLRTTTLMVVFSLSCGFMVRLGRSAARPDADQGSKPMLVHGSAVSARGNSKSLDPCRRVGRSSGSR